MDIRRQDREELAAIEDRSREAIVVASGALRAGESGYYHSKSQTPATATHLDDRMSMFWKVFGGTIISISALVAVTLYNNLTSQINELRTELSRVNEARGEMVKKEEYNSRSQAMWDRVQNLQELRVSVTSLKEQLNAQGDKAVDAKAVNDKLGTLEQRLKVAEEDHKSLMKTELTIAGLEQKAAARETQLKAIEEERKELSKQLQELRERLAKVEGVTEVKPMPKSAPAKVKE